MRGSVRSPRGGRGSRRRRALRRRRAASLASFRAPETEPRASSSCRATGSPSAATPVGRAAADRPSKARAFGFSRSDRASAPARLDRSGRAALGDGPRKTRCGRSASSLGLPRSPRHARGPALLPATSSGSGAPPSPSWAVVNMFHTTARGRLAADTRVAEEPRGPRPRSSSERGCAAGGSVAPRPRYSGRASRPEIGAWEQCFESSGASGYDIAPQPAISACPSAVTIRHRRRP